MQTADLAMMGRALELAERGRGYVEPNPLVGAVVVRDGQVVGEGWHERFGQAHAEVNALHAAGAAARGATLYVTLEPCAHQGKTPPCTEAILRAGIRQVVAAMEDPFTEVKGRGFARLRAAGVEVEIGVAEAEARVLNAPYLKLLSTGQPYVIAKWAMSLDGKIATAAGESKWITGPAARERVHQLRGRMDAILIGIGTALADDPLLTARPPGPRVAARVILDSRLRLPRESQLVRTAHAGKVLVIHTPIAPAEARRALEDAGCECTAVEPQGSCVSIPALLAELGRRRMTNVLVEGGAAILGGFFALGEIDEAYAFVAAKLIGGDRAPGPLGGEGIRRLADARLLDAQLETIGPDWLIHGRLRSR